MLLNTLWGPEEIKETKICSQCKEVKHLSEFTTRAHRKDGSKETHNHCKICNQRQTKFLRKYRNTIPKPDENYICPCCKKNEKEIKEHFGGLQGHTSRTKKTIWTLDHDHESLKIREYVCLYCNDTLSRSGDSPKTLRGCANYLERHNEKKRNFSHAY